MDCGPGSTPIPTPCVTPGQCFALPESLHWMRDTNEGLGGLLWGHLWCPVPCHYFSAGVGNLIVLQTKAIVSGWTGVGHQRSSPWHSQLVGWGAQSLELILRPLGGTEGPYPILHCRTAGMGGVHFVFSVLSCPAPKGQLFLSPSWI